MSGVVLLILRILMAAVLYAFLGWVIYTLWSDLRQQERMAHNNIPALALTGTGQFIESFTFTQSVVTVGRSPFNDLPIDNPTVSNYHARLHYHANQWWLDDLSSTNGTFLNGDRVTTSTVLTTGDVIEFGEVGLLVSIGQNM